MNKVNHYIYSHIIPILGNLAIQRNKYINVIYYHDIVESGAFTFMRTDSNVFRKHMECISSNGFKTFTFNDLNNDPNNLIFKPNHLLISFDDGWKSNYKILPLMKRLGLKYNVFLEVARIGNDPDYLTWDEIREMHESGMVGFGAHTLNHVNMSSIDGYDFNEETIRANEIIKREIGYQPKDFCFPFGAYCEESLSKIVDSKLYDRIYTSNMTYSYLRGESIIMGRSAISTEDSMSILMAKATGKFNIFKTLYKICRR